MNKEEVLSRSRKENKDGDEREMQIMANASKVGMAVGGILSVILAIVSSFSDEANLIGITAWAIYFSMIGSNDIYQYIKTKKRKNLIGGIITIIACIASLVSLIILIAL